MPTYQSPNGALTSDEMARLDQLLGGARSFHYTAMILAGLSLALSSLDESQAVTLPITGIVLPSTQAAVGLYLLVIVLVMAADRLFLMAVPWMEHDARRPPFPWIALGTGKLSIAYVTRWLFLPLVACAIATGITLKGDFLGFSLAIVGMSVILMPRVVEHYMNLISTRADHRGGPATFSIYLLYWYRVLRSICYGAFFLGLVLATIPAWRPLILRLAGILAAVVVATFVLRHIGTVGLVYRRIDRFGTRWGFPPRSQHYS